MERIVYDADGQLLTGSLMDYALPRASDMPSLSIGKMSTPSPANALGAKGVGEAGTIGGAGRDSQRRQTTRCAPMAPRSSPCR